jgi:hypothetical protein
MSRTHDVLASVSPLRSGRWDRTVGCYARTTRTLNAGVPKLPMRLSHSGR